MDARGVRFTKVEDITNGGKILCTDFALDYEYHDGTPTEKVIGTKYEVVFPGRKFAGATIKTPELTPSVTEADLILNGGSVTIELINFSASVYLDNRTGRPALSLKAHAVRIVPSEEPLAQ